MTKLRPLRGHLDLMPSPVPDRPGLLIRDPYRYSESTLIIPPALVSGLACFDGEQDENALRAALAPAVEPGEVGRMARRLIAALAEAGFLWDETFHRLKRERELAFAAACRREPAHSGGAYPDEPEALRAALDDYMAGGTDPDDRRPPASPGLVGLAAPHVSPDGGWRSYQAAYRALVPEHRERLVVILGTSHYGAPDRFGLTRKSFVTPLGTTSVDAESVDFLAARGQGAVTMEDYCHAVEHSIEFQVVFLQHLLGPNVAIVPILCGGFTSRGDGARPEAAPEIEAFFGALRELAARQGDRLLWVLGVDMAHVGRRYADPLRARSGLGPLAQVAKRDRHRIERLAAGDADGFWDLLSPHDDLKWCGASPLYTFLRCASPVRGELHRYEQWNIDESSVVSFAGMTFTRPPGGSSGDPRPGQVSIEKGVKSV